MKFRDLTFKDHTIEGELRKFGLKKIEDCRSKAQYDLGQMLATIYGSSNITEDFPLPGCGNLSWDFWIIPYKIAFEYQGEQHDKFNKFFHGTRAGFLKQKKRDIKKQELADLNGIRLIEIRGEITLEELKRKIIDAQRS